MSAFAIGLQAELAAQIYALTSDVNRDIISLDARISTFGSLSLHEVHGIAPEGHTRLWIGAYAEDEDSIGVVLAATKDRVAADWSVMGQSGAQIGNRIHVARSFDIALEVARRTGVRRFVNSPIDSRVAAIYEAMGFEGGKSLNIWSTTATQQAYRFIDAEYAEASREFPAFTRPW